jgi:Domain of unknown function (DUF4440)
MAENTLLIKNSIVGQYFQTLSNGDFEAAANLFSTDGVMYPPFHPPVEGRDVIANYFQEEAQGINLVPTDYSVEILDSGEVVHHVLGKVQTSLLKVNASWQIVLDEETQIQSAKVKLLASLKELMNLRR